MTRVDFYLLPGQDPHTRRAYACRIAEKAYRTGHKVFILAADDTEAKILDDLLWTFRQGSFIPHILAENYPNDPMVPIVIGTSEAPESFDELLINLNPNPPENWQQIHRIAEVINEVPEIRQAGRKKYRIYQEQEAELHTHKIES
ncbi:MAG: hypothetical protein AXA67_13920 [Methylothermaceae bacteria B42]|nr:MAG: hypothetical protein AXA67_13920 [Methylothermaceae bacteria B42]HHJ38278.1 DNA polymerase III subunit chi [Methylothermaceae bacterium]